MTVGYELSPLQRRLIAQGGEATEFATTIVWRGVVPAEEFRAALARVAARHEILSSSFVRPAAATMPLQLPGVAPTIVEHPDQPPAIRVVSTVSDDGVEHEVMLSGLVADAGCIPLLHRELIAELDGVRQEPATTDYSMMAQWLNELPGSADDQALMQHWRDTDADERWLVRGKVTAPTFISQECTVPAERWHRLRDVAMAGGFELRDLMSAVWSVVLAQSTGEPTVTLGCYTDGRIDADLAGLMGPLGRLLPVRVAVAAETTLAASACAIHEAWVAGAQRAEGFRLGPSEHFTAGFGYLDLPAEGRLRVCGVSARGELTEVRLTCLDSGVLAIDAMAGAGFEAPQLMGRLLTCLELVTSEARLDQLDVLPPAEAHRAVIETPAPVSEHVSVLSVFAERVTLTPHAEAVAGDLSYLELDVLAGRYAAAIAGMGGEPGRHVVLRLNRSAAFAAALLGAWRVGAVPIPVDPRLPMERVHRILGRAQAVGVVDDDAALAEPVRYDRRPAGHDPAYCVFTSGSTGEPKGVVVGHAAFALHCLGMAAELGLTAEDRLPLLASTGFDVSLEQTCLPWTVGAVSCPQPLPTPTLDELTEFLIATRATVLNVNPSLWRVLGEQWRVEGTRPKDVALVILGAEVLRASDVALVGEVLPQARVCNAYGPTETVVTSTLDIVTGVGEPTIGRPLPGRWAAVVDGRGLPVPRGTVGQLVIGGPCLAAGYLDDPVETAARFVRLSRGQALQTGDWAILRDDGRLEFHGRRDRQVKVLGQRVELDEVEKALADCPGVDHAVAVSVNDGIVAAITPSDADLVEARRLLATRLPHYMVPGRIVAVAALPRLANGKVDYPRVAAWARREDDLAEAPRTDIERLVARLWAEVLERDDISRSSDFFELGGQSLKAIIIATRLRNELAADIKVTTLFGHSRLCDFAAEVDRLRSAATTIPALPRERVYRYEPSHAQKRLWFLGEFIADSSAYNAPLALIAPRRLSLEETVAAWERLAVHHDALRTTFTDRDGLVTAVVGEQSQVMVQLVDLSVVGPSEEAFEKAYADELACGFDLANGPLGRVVLFWMPDGSSRVFVNLHHIVTDLWSTRVLLSDFIACLDGGEPISTPNHSYRDYAAWERGRADSGAWAVHERFLLSEMDPPPPPLELPFDHARPEVQSYAGDDLIVALGGDVKSRVERFADRRGLTPFMVFLTAYLILLRRLSNQDDITVGFPAAGRERPEFQQVVGFFVSTSFVRVDFSMCRTVEALLDEVRRKVVKAMECQEYPFDRLVSKAKLSRSVSHAPVFTSMLAHQDLPPLPPELIGRGWRLMELPDPISKYDLGATTWFDDEEAHFGLTYNTALFTAGSARRFVEMYRTCLTRLLETP